MFKFASALLRVMLLLVGLVLVLAGVAAVATAPLFAELGGSTVVLQALAGLTVAALGLLACSGALKL